MTPPPLSQGDVKLSKPGYVYLLRSLKDGKYYTGWTIDVQRRLEAHNAGAVSSTKRRRPFELIYFEACASHRLAKEREGILKRNPNMFYLFKKRALNSKAAPLGAKEVVG